MEYDTLLIDTFRVSDHPQIKDAVELILSSDPAPPAHKKYRYTVQRIVINLYLAKSYGVRLSIPLGKDRYRDGQCMRSFKHSHVTHALALMERLHLITRHGSSHQNGDGGAAMCNRFTSFSMTPLMDGMFPKDIIIEYDWSAFNPMAMKEGRIPYTPMTRRMTEEMTLFNECIRAHHITTPWEACSPLLGRFGIKLLQQQEFVGIQFKAQRVFARGDKKLRFGGRIYTSPLYDPLHPQCMPSDVRKQLRFNGMAVSERDYSCIHVRMAFALVGIQQSGDIYQMIDAPRDAVKDMMLIVLNAQSEDIAVRAYMRRNRCKKVEAQALYNAVVSGLEPIKKYIANDAGIRFQRRDSDIAALVVNHFTSQGVLCVPIHDSFIVPVEYDDELVDVMDGAYKQITGGFSCPIK